MKVNTEYICEICNYSFTSEAGALACEAIGPPKLVWPIGTVSMGEPGDFYDDTLAFAIAMTKPSKHSFSTALWACRDSQYGDSLGTEMCGGGFSFEPNEFKEHWLNRPPMVRLLAWLKSERIKVTVCVKGKPVELAKVI